jgi:hypothetical protein
MCCSLYPDWYEISNRATETTVCEDIRYKKVSARQVTEQVAWDKKTSRRLGMKDMTLFQVPSDKTCFCHYNLDAPEHHSNEAQVPESTFCWQREVTASVFRDILSSSTSVSFQMVLL